MTTEHIEELNDQQLIRREKMAALAEQGIDPFGKRFERTADSAQLKEKYNVMSVPCLVINQDKVTFGKKNIQQLLEVIGTGNSNEI